MGITMHHVDIDVKKEMAKFPLEAVFSRVYVKEFEVEKAGRLFVPHSAKEGTLQTHTGVVLALGAEVDAQFQLGQVIYYARHSGAWIRFRGEKYRVMNEEDVLGIVKEVK